MPYDDGDEHDDDTIDAEDEHDDDDGDEPDDDDEHEEPPRPQARPRARTQAAAPVGVLSIFGAVPQKATHYRVLRRSPAGVWEKMSFAAPGGTHAEYEWPLADLSHERVRARWGGGHYRVEWLQLTPRGGLRRIANGRELDILEQHAPAPPSPVAPVGGLPPALAETFALMQVIDQRSTSQLQSLLQLANAPRPGSGGLDAPTLALLLQSQQQTMTAALERMQAATNEQIATLARRLERLDDDDDDEPSAEAREPRPVRLPRDAGIVDMIKAYAMANPDKALEIVAGIPSLFAAIADLAKRQAPPAPPAPERPRPVARAPLPPTTPNVEAPAPASTGPGLNSFTQDKAGASAAPPAPTGAPS